MFGLGDYFTVLFYKFIIFSRSFQFVEVSSRGPSWGKRKRTELIPEIISDNSFAPVNYCKNKGFAGFYISPSVCRERFDRKNHIFPDSMAKKALIIWNCDPCMQLILFEVVTGQIFYGIKTTFFDRIFDYLPYLTRFNPVLCVSNCFFKRVFAGMDQQAVVLCSDFNSSSCICNIAFYVSSNI